MTYKEWMKEVDRIVVNTIGMSVYDLADFLSRDAYEDGASPEEGAREAIENDDLAMAYMEELHSAVRG